MMSYTRLSHTVLWAALISFALYWLFSVANAQQIRCTSTRVGNQTYTTCR